jgi:hypothetical protein
MDYKKIYDDLMQSRLLMKEERIKSKKAGEYFEAHHIVPVCMGGEGHRTDYRHDNIVMLTAREHYIAHGLLFLVYRTRELAFALHCICTLKHKRDSDYKVSARLYDFLKQERKKLGVSSETRLKRSLKLKGRVVSKETREKLRIAHTGRKLPDYQKIKMSMSRTGKVHSEESKQKMRESALGKKMSAEAIEKMSRYRKGKKFRLGVVSTEETRRKIGESKIGNKYRLGSKHTEESKQKISNSMSGRKVSEETKQKISNSMSGRKKTPEQIENMKIVWMKRKEGMTK